MKRSIPIGLSFSLVCDTGSPFADSLDSSDW